MRRRRPRPSRRIRGRPQPAVGDPARLLADAAQGGRADSAGGRSRQEALQALFGGPAPRSRGETSMLDAAGDEHVAEAPAPSPAIPTPRSSTRARPPRRSSTPRPRPARRHGHDAAIKDTFLAVPGEEFQNRKPSDATNVAPAPWRCRLVSHNAAPPRSARALAAAERPVPVAPQSARIPAVPPWR